MFSRILIATALTAAALIPSSASAAEATTRVSIRSMPITQRPSRPGHFYGNTVRRAHQRRSG
jgi:uncharacterized protein YraI